MDLGFLKAEGRGGDRSEGFIFANCKKNLFCEFNS